jgi:hypothetical protein
MLHAFEALAALIDRTVDPPGGNVVALEPERLVVGLSALVLKVMETLKVTEAPLPGSVCAPAQRSPLAEFPRASAELPGASAELP